MVMGSSKGFSSPVDSFEIDKYINDYRLLEIRCGVLEEERVECASHIQEAKVKIKAIDKTMSQLSSEKEDCIARLKKVQQELDLINNFEQQQADLLEDAHKDLKKQEQASKFIEDALKPLKAEKDKAFMMVRTLAPERERELKL